MGQSYNADREEASFLVNAPNVFQGMNNFEMRLWQKLGHRNNNYCISKHNQQVSPPR